MSSEKNNKREQNKATKAELKPYMMGISFAATNFIVILMVYYEVLDTDIASALWLSLGVLIAAVLYLLKGKKKLQE